jgi:glucose/arabinose dehydrogenase
MLLAGSVLFQACKKSDSPVSADQGTFLSKVKTTGVDLQQFSTGYVSPLGVVPFPDNTGRLAVIDQVGQVWITDANGNKMATPFIDVASKMVTLSPGYDERGLLGLAFHPNYATNGKFYIYYTAPPNPGGPTPTTTWNNLSTISEFRVSAANPNVADMASERFLFRLNDPQSNHNGGTIAFGPDGYLYIAIGDGGAANDVAPGHVEDWYPVNAGGNAQNIEANLFGKILRINPTSGNPYSIPSDNPFVGKTGLDEIWAYGFRNPYRFSFDMTNGDLIAGDAGQVLYEEIDFVKKGGNYGWNVREGRHCFNAANNMTTFPSCPDKDGYGNKLTDPVIEIDNWQNPDGDGRATTIIGGNVYRGDAIKELKGKYIFGTFSQTPTTADGEMFVAKTNGNNSWQFAELPLESFPNDIGHFLKGFGHDRWGELYVAASGMLGPAGTTGVIYKLVPAN